MSQKKSLFRLIHDVCFRIRRVSMSDYNRCQLPTTEVVGLSVGLPGFALPHESPTPVPFKERAFSGAFSTGVGETRSAPPDSRDG